MYRTMRVHRMGRPMSHTPQRKRAMTVAGGISEARSPRGEILWETPVGDGGRDNLKAGADGVLYGQTEKHLKAYNGDGTVKFDHTFEMPVREHYMDSSGNHYFIQSDSRELYMVDRDGARKDLPEQLKGIKSNEVVQTSADELMLREGKDFCRFNLKEGRKEEAFTFNDTAKQESNITRYIEHFEVDGSGRSKGMGQQFSICAGPFLCR